MQTIPVKDVIWINSYNIHVRGGYKSNIQIVGRDKRMIVLSVNARNINIYEIVKSLRRYRPNLLFSDGGEISVFNAGSGAESRRYFDLYKNDFDRMIQLSDGYLT